MVCAGCKFYRPLSPDAGQCRRFPPIVVLGQAGWIVVGADELGCGEFIGNQQRPADGQDEFAKKLEVDIFANSPDFEVPIYNVWKQQTKTAGVNHFGNSEVRWLDNLLYLYTNPADIVVDPFAGSGSTIDLCKKRQRRYWVADRKPIVEREHEIRKHDLDAPP